MRRAASNHRDYLRQRVADAIQYIHQVNAESSINGGISFFSFTRRFLKFGDLTSHQYTVPYLPPPAFDGPKQSKHLTTRTVMGAITSLTATSIYQKLERVTHFATADYSEACNEHSGMTEDQNDP